ncbi:MAG: 3-hydroxyacyl-CoA dehydrogenase NAD-binding domain-containing protein [Candidatus Kapaibacterium sp.]
MVRKKFGVCGSGTMGVGIAYAAAAAGYDVRLYDLNDQILAKAGQTIDAFISKGVERGKLTEEEGEELRGRVVRTTDLSEMSQATIVVEAIVERLDVKQELFRKLEEVLSADAIIGTNTSSIAVTEMANGLQNPERVVGMHFFNPAHIMKLVEVIKGYATSEEVMQRTVDLSIELGKTPVRVKDTPGFIVNRVARNFYGEAFRIVGEGAASHEQVDRCLKSVGFRMGPFELMDLIGIDVNFAVTQSVYGQYFNEARFQPHLIQKKMVESGRIGKKAGGGFYG